MTKIGNARVERRQSRTSTSYIRCGILALVIGCFVTLYTISWSADLTERLHTNPSPSRIRRQQAEELTNLPPPRSFGAVASASWLPWTKEEAYMNYCTHHYKGNATWGKQHAPYVDKISAKQIVANTMNVPKLKIIPTLAVLGRNNITEKYTLEFMQSLKQPYIIKATHLSGG